jgi:flavorubredoxin
MMVPQHGRIFRGDDVGRFLDWFEGLEVGIAGRRPGSSEMTRKPAA